MVAHNTTSDIIANEEEREGTLILNPDGQPLPLHSSTSDTPPWTLRAVLLALALGFFLGPMLVTGVLMSLLQNAFPHLEQRYVMMIFSFAAPVACWVVILRYWIRQYGWNNLLQHIGLLNRLPWAANGMYTLVCLLMMLTVGLLLGYLVEIFKWSFEMPDMLFSPEQAPVVAIFAIATAPILEEIAFRGLLQSALSHRLRVPFWAIPLTAVIFVLFHSLYFGNWLAMVYVFLLGLTLGWVRQKSGSLVPCILGHFLNNLLATTLIWH